MELGITPLITASMALHFVSVGAKMIRDNDGKRQPSTIEVSDDESMPFLQSIRCSETSISLTFHF